MFYHFVEAIKNFGTYRFSNLICIWTISMALVIIGVFLLIIVNLNSLAETLKQKVEVVAFIKNDISNEEIAQLKSVIQRYPEIESVHFTSREMALERFMQDEEFARQIEILGENPLPSSFEITLAKGLDIPPRDIVERLGILEGITDVRYGKEAISNLKRIVGVVRFISFILIIVVGITALSIVNYTIKLALYNRYEGIRITKLIGATDSFISTAFLAEGIIQGIIGGSLCIIFLYLVYYFVSTRIANLSFLSTNNLIWLILGGITMGFLGNLFSLKGYLRHE